MAHHFRYIILLGILALGMSFSPLVWGVDPLPVESKGKLVKSAIKEMSGKILIDAQVEVTHPLQINKWLDLVEISTPSTPSAGHARIFLTPVGTGTQQQLSVIFDDGTAVRITGN